MTKSLPVKLFLGEPYIMLTRHGRVQCWPMKRSFRSEDTLLAFLQKFLGEIHEEV